MLRGGRLCRQQTMDCFVCQRYSDYTAMQDFCRLCWVRLSVSSVDYLFVNMITRDDTITLKSILQILRILVV